jgi:type II/III secretion system protein
MTGQMLRRLGLASVFGAALALPAPAVAQEKERSERADPAQQRTTDMPAAKPEKSKWTVKAFELKHRNPEEMNQILTKQWTEPQPAVMASTVMIGPGGYPVRVGVPQTPTQPISATQRTSAYPSTDSHLLVSFDPQARLFFVRGPEEKVRKAEELVKALDVTDSQLKQVDFDGMHMIPVRQDKLQQVTRTLSDLRISNWTKSLGNAAFVVIRDESESDGIVEQVRTVISKYDAGTQVGAEKTTTTEKRTEKTETTEKKDR